jgi:hypothetical protein
MTGFSFISIFTEKKIKLIRGQAFHCGGPGNLPFWFGD